MAATSTPAARRKVKTWQVLGDYKEFEEKLTATLPPPRAPEPDNISSVDPSEFPGDVWFAATISPDNGVAVIASYRELCKARELYQQQLGNIHTTRRQQEMLIATGTLASRGGTLGRTITDTMKLGADLRKLDKFEQQQQVWDGMAYNLAGRTGRPPHDLAMQRGHTWRTRAELVDLLYRAQPLDVRGTNPEIWNMSLRDAWERIIPLGSIFSGLSLVIKEKPGLQPGPKSVKVGRPLDPSSSRPPALPPPMAGTLGRPPQGRSLSARHRAWEDGPVLAQRLEEYRKRIKALQPHDPEVGTLKLRGEALESQLEALAFAPVTLAEVETHLRSHAPDAYESYKAVKDEMEAQMRAALEAEAQMAMAAAEEARAGAPQPGPHLEASTSYLTLACVAGEATSASFSVSHRGTAAVRYRWQLVPAARLPNAPSGDASSQVPRFFLPQQSGILLPGQVQEFAVTFCTVAPGTYTETYRLVTVPQNLGPEVSISLRGYAEQSDESTVRRAAFEAALAEKEKMAKVRAALERILADVKPPAKPVVPEGPEESAAGEAWDRTHLESHWPPLYHSPALQAELADVYAQALAALTAVLAPQSDEDPKKKRKEAPPSGGGKKKGVQEEACPEPKRAPRWPGTLSSLDSLLAELQGLAPAAAAPLLARADGAKASARVPGSKHKLLARAMRAVVHRMVDMMEDKLTAAEADNQAALRLAETGGADAEASSSATATAPASTGISPAKPDSSSAISKHQQLQLQQQQEARARQSISGQSTLSLLSHGSSTALDPAALRDKMVALTKHVVKGQVGLLNDELNRHRVAVGDHLEGLVKGIDAQLAAGGDAEQLYWQRFELLRTWTSLGVPPRAGIQ